MGRTTVLPNDAALIRLAGVLLIEQNDEWLVGRRYLSQESLAALAMQETELSDIPDQDDHTHKNEIEKDEVMPALSAA